MPQLELSTYASQVFWLVVCFGILCVFMGTFIAPRIGLSLHQRAKTLEDQAEAAKKLLEGAESIHQKNHQQLSHARHEAAKQLHQAVHDLNHHRHETIREFDRNLHGQLSELSHKLDHQKQEILATSQDLVTDLVETLFHKITNIAALPNDVANAIRTVKIGDNQ